MLTSPSQDLPSTEFKKRYFKLEFFKVLLLRVNKTKRKTMKMFSDTF